MFEKLQIWITISLYIYIKKEKEGERKKKQYKFKFSGESKRFLNNKALEKLRNQERSVLVN